MGVFYQSSHFEGRRWFRERVLIACGVYVCCGVVAGCGADDPAPEEEPVRGALIKAKPLGEQPPEFTNLVMASVEADTTVDQAVTAYEITYWSPNVAGDLVRLSALVAYPSDPSGALPLLSYQHGTLVLRDTAPSRAAPSSLASAQNNPEGAFVFGFAARGTVAVAADYVGLGGSDEFHPYLHAETEASSVIDALRAARELAERNGVELDDQLFLAGYSQGGHATMAAHRAIERDHEGEFTVVASAPMAGPYDLSGVTAAAILGDADCPHPFFLAYVLLAYNRIYELAAADGELFAEAVATSVPSLFDGETESDLIDQALVPAGEAPPKVPRDSLAADFVEGLASDDHPLFDALRDNDVYDWTPRAPVRLYQCSGDQDVPPENAQVALDTLTANGATVELIEPPGGEGAGHVECFLPSLLDFSKWLDEMRTDSD